MSRESYYRTYAASCSHDGGIYRYDLSRDGKLTETGKIPLDCPTYFIKKDDIFHILLRNPSDIGGMSGYVACPADAECADMAGIISTGGIVACHLEVIENDIYAVNYTSGSISKINYRTVVHKPHEKMAPGRQDKPHTHCVILSPDKKYVLCTDLGLDQIFVYDRDLNKVSVCNTEHGHGVRHIIFHTNKKYIYSVNELGSSVSVFLYNDGRLNMQGTYSCRIVTPGNTAAAIRMSPDNKYLYASQRGENCITVFSVNKDGDKLEWLKNVPCGGRGPRDFILTPDGKFLITANENSGNLAVFSVKNGCEFELCDNAELKNALCVIAEISK